MHFFWFGRRSSAHSSRCNGVTSASRARQDNTSARVYHQCSSLALVDVQLVIEVNQDWRYSRPDHFVRFIQHNISLEIGPSISGPHVVSTLQIYRFLYVGADCHLEKNPSELSYTSSKINFRASPKCGFSLYETVAHSNAGSSYRSYRTVQVFEPIP